MEQFFFLIFHDFEFLFVNYDFGYTTKKVEKNLKYFAFYLQLIICHSFTYTTKKVEKNLKKSQKNSPSSIKNWGMVAIVCPAIWASRDL